MSRHVTQVTGKNMARPSSYNIETAEEICQRMVEGKGLLKICSDRNMPDRATVYRWLDDNKEFRGKYARAREALMDFYAEQILQIAFDESGDVVIEQDGNKSRAVANHAKVQRDRLKVDSLKWTASRLFPKRYGDKMELLGQTIEEGESINKIELVGVQPQGMRFSWQDDIRVIVHPMLGEDGSLLKPDTPEYEEAVAKAARHARDSGAQSVTLGYDIAPGAGASVADLMRSVDGRTRTVDPDAPNVAEKSPQAPPLAITYQQTPPPADLTPEAWSAIARVSELIERIAPGDEKPEHIFGLIEGFLRSHYLEERSMKQEEIAG
jgi:hypothetical protein